MDANSLHENLLAIAQAVRAEFASRDQSRLCLEIEIDGRADGDLTLTYGIGEYGAEVKASTLPAVLSEFFRRKAWAQRHDPLCLPNS